MVGEASSKTVPLLLQKHGAKRKRSRLLLMNSQGVDIIWRDILLSPTATMKILSSNSLNWSRKFAPCNDWSPSLLDFVVSTKKAGLLMGYEWLRLKRLGQSPASSVFRLLSKTWLSGPLLRWFHQLYSPINSVVVGRRNRILTNDWSLNPTSFFISDFLVESPRR